jgi:hypothetical protein
MRTVRAVQEGAQKDQRMHWNIRRTRFT